MSIAGYLDDWEQSYPEPHGAQANNLGVYRDAGFTDSACAFLRRQGLASNYNRVFASMAAEDPDTTGPDASDIPPWFAVASFTNPHDIATYPGVDRPGAARPGLGHRHPVDLRAADRPARQAQATPPPTAGHDPDPAQPRWASRRIARGRRRPRTSRSPTSRAASTRRPTRSAWRSPPRAGSTSSTGWSGAIPPATGDHADEAAVAFSLKSCIPFQLSRRSRRRIAACSSSSTPGCTRSSTCTSTRC